MKSYLLFAAAVLIFVAPISAVVQDSRGSAFSNPTGLVAYYSFDAAGALGNDSIGNRSSGTAHSVFYTFPAVVYGGSLFDGVNAFVSIPPSPTFNLSAFTVAAWVKADKLCSVRPKFGAGDF